MSHSFTNGKWSDPAVPKRDWYCIGGYDRGRDNLEPCEMCESAAVRYVHSMRHDDYPDTLDVGCICAGNMEQDAESAKRREATVRNRSKRREKWLLRKWRPSRNGNPTLRVSGCFVTVFRKGQRWGWLIYRRADGQKWFSPDSPELYATEEAAKRATFEELEKLCEEPAAPDTMSRKHWIYPSTIVGCGLDADNLCSDELTCLRSEVTCQRCVARLSSDKERCQACKLGALESVRLALGHVCDPALV